MDNLNNIDTEQRNIHSANLDQLSVHEAVELMNTEDKKVAPAVGRVHNKIADAVELIIEHFEKGGRLIYIGAGSSGRLGVLDAAECPPTFSTDPEMVQAIIAGGEKAILEAIEGAEDDEKGGEADLKRIDLNEKDVVVGIAASGRTPYVIGALEYANLVGSSTISLSCTRNSKIGRLSNVNIEVSVGPEVLTGSTRLKAATAQKMVLNMLSTLSMVGIGKVYQNFMVDVKPSNNKLKLRAVQIVMESTQCSQSTAYEVLEESDFEVKPAIVSIMLNISVGEAINKLSAVSGHVSKTLDKKTENGGD